MELRNSNGQYVYLLADAVYFGIEVCGIFNQQNRICWVIPLIVLMSLLIKFYQSLVCESVMLQKVQLNLGPLTSIRPQFLLAFPTMNQAQLICSFLGIALIVRNTSREKFPPYLPFSGLADPFSERAGKLSGCFLCFTALLLIFVSQIIGFACIFYLVCLSVCV